MTDYEKYLKDIKANSRITDHEEWETANGDKAITAWYNSWYAE